VTVLRAKLVGRVSGTTTVRASRDSTFAISCSLSIRWDSRGMDYQYPPL
jgi:hypothetical protein